MTLVSRAMIGDGSLLSMLTDLSAYLFYRRVVEERTFLDGYCNSKRASLDDSDFAGYRLDFNLSFLD